MDIIIDMDKYIDNVFISKMTNMGARRVMIGDAEHNILTIDGLSDWSLKKLKDKITEWLERGH